MHQYRKIIIVRKSALSNCTADNERTWKTINPLKIVIALCVIIGTLRKSRVSSQLRTNSYLVLQISHICSISAQYAGEV